MVLASVQPLWARLREHPVSATLPRMRSLSLRLALAAASPVYIAAPARCLDAGDQHHPFTMLPYLLVPYPLALRLLPRRRLPAPRPCSLPPNSTSTTLRLLLPPRSPPHQPRCALAVLQSHPSRLLKIVPTLRIWPSKPSALRS